LTIWALSDPHLSFGTKDKSMDIFGPSWLKHAEKIEKGWVSRVDSKDLVLVPGDISWAMRLDEALPDLEWLHNLPGTKLLVKGNHDYWWASSTKMKAVLPPSIEFLSNSVFNWNGASIGGAKLWDSKEYSFERFIEFRPNPKAKPPHPKDIDQEEKIFCRELDRLELSLKQLDPNAKLRMAITHYPPIGADLQPSRASAILERHGIQICVFGHLHNIKKEFLPLFGSARGVQYILSSCDAIDFIPIKVC
jgi:uncharacterized protein